MPESVPQYLHKPLRILWFDSDDLMIMMVAYIIAMSLGGYLWLGVIAVPVAYIFYKNNKPRGFLRHVFYQLGIYRLQGYPSPYIKRFHP